jgi:hypothetical protein
MELRQNMRRATTRPLAWAAAILIALAIGLTGWNALTTVAPSQATNVSMAPATTAIALLDRNAERQQQGPTSRMGGPGGQIGDAP